MSNKIVKMKKPPKELKLDLGCGTTKQAGYFGVDIKKFPGVDLVLDLRKKWPWKDESVDEIYCSHTIEHLTNFDERYERVHFFNECYRVLKFGGTAKIILPHWCSTRYYGDPTHKEPFGEMGFYYLKREWREKEAPATCDLYSCDFETTWAYSLAPWMAGKSQDFVSDALSRYKEAAQDLIGTLTKQPKKS